MELFFEVYRGKQHIMADTRENGTVADIKYIISGIMQVPVSDITIKRPTNETLSNWETVESDKSLHELGYTPKTAKPDDPAPLAYTLSIDNDMVSIDPISDPPPLHDALQANGC